MGRIRCVKGELSQGAAARQPSDHTDLDSYVPKLATTSWVCASLGEEKRDGLSHGSPRHKALPCLFPASVAADFRMVTGASLRVIPRGGIHIAHPPRMAQARPP